MITRIKSFAVTGIEAIPVDVEIKTWEMSAPETSYFNIVGLGDSAVRESKERIRAAIWASGFHVPKGIVVNLSPAELRKSGSAFDLPMALGILVASNQLPYKMILNKLFIGELGLDGRLNSVKGSVIIAIELKEQDSLKLDKSELILPYCNLAETSLIKEVEKRGAESLLETIAYLKGEKPLPTELFLKEGKSVEETIIEVKGQEHAKKALLIAGSGGHNLLMIGPPGCGKSLLAKNFKSLLPALTFDEQIEVLKIYSISGLKIDEILASRRPFRCPHHSASSPGIIGGGNPPRPGEISLAHRGVLFLDEIPEFPRTVLESLRAPIEDGIVRIVRARESHQFPARFQFIAAMNPCPCGKLGTKAIQCGCSVLAIQNYVNRISQPIMDRIDMHLQLNPVPIKELINNSSQTENEKIKETISSVSENQRIRQGKLNAELNSQEVLEIIKPDKEIVDFLDNVSEKMALSARGCMKVLKVAQTIADIHNLQTQAESRIGISHVKEAIGYRKLEKYLR